MIVTACFLSPSQVNNAVLLTHGALPTLALLLLDLAGAVQRLDAVGLELVREMMCGACFTLCLYVSAVSFSIMLNLSLQLACPVLRCLSNLLTEVPAEAMGQQMELRDERLVAALFIFLQFFLQKQPALLPEGLWLLNNLTGIYYILPRPDLLSPLKYLLRPKEG